MSKCRCTYADTCAKRLIGLMAGSSLNQWKQSYLKDLVSSNYVFVGHVNHVGISMCWEKKILMIYLKFSVHQMLTDGNWCQIKEKNLLNCSVHHKYCRVSQSTPYKNTVVGFLSSISSLLVLARCNQSRVRHMNSWQDVRCCQPV